ncbi:MAG: polysulfide reductase [Chloroflexota bacterium]
MKPLRLILWVLIALSLIVGAWGVYDRLVNGHENTTYGSYVVWGLWVAMYLFLVGTAAGTFFFATLDYLFRVKLFQGTGRLALFATLITLGAGLLHIWFDLGHMERIWKVYTRPNPQSVMAQIVWGYTLFGLLVLVMLAIALRPQYRASAGGGDGRRWLALLSALGLPLTLFLSGGVRALLGVEISRPFWHVGLFPVQFPVFSLASGVALMLVIIGLFGDASNPQQAQQLRVLAIATIVLQVVKLYFLWADYSQSLYGGLPQNVAAINAVLFGPYWWAFWILQILLGSLVPIFILVLPGVARRPAWTGVAGALILFGFAVARANIVFPALTVPEIEALQQAFSDPRLQFAYFPSPMEWALSIGILGAAAAAFLLGYTWLRLSVVQQEVA